MALQLEFQKSPSVFAYMVRAFLPSAGLKRVQKAPKFQFRQEKFVFTKEKVKQLNELCGISPGRERVSILFPQILGFPLLMRAVTDPSFPEPIWNALQIRNQFTLHRPIELDRPYRLELQTGDTRIFEKGAEVDFKLSLLGADKTIWESLTTFYYRGKFGQASSSNQARPPENVGGETDQWTLPTDGRLAFGKLSGDYNGIHLWNPYARLFGFKSAFLHPHRVVGRALDRLAADQDSIRQLDVWFRGPAPYGAQVRLHSCKEENQTQFGIFLQDETRPLIVGHFGPVECK